MARPITETPNVFFSGDKRPGASGIASSVVIKVLVIITGKITVFFAVDGVVYEWENTCWEAAAVEIKSLCASTGVIAEISTVILSELVG